MGPVRVVAAVMAAGALAGSAVLSLLWLLQPDSYWFVLIASYIPYALPGYLVAALALLVVRRSGTAPLRRSVTGALVVALAGLAFHGVLLAPSYFGAHPDGEPDLVVVTLNQRLGHANAPATVALLRRERADVAVLEEVTPALRERLVAAGIRDRFPYAAGQPGPGAQGTMIFSRFALSEAVTLPLEHGAVRVRVAAARPFWCVAVHLGQPIKSPGAWRADWSLINQVLPGLVGPVVVAGDFNSTLDHATMRTLLGNGYDDAARQANSGWQPTWPSWAGLIAIDHVLVHDGYGAISTSTRAVKGTDHRALVARLSTLDRS